MFNELSVLYFHYDGREILISFLVFWFYFEQTKNLSQGTTV